MDIRDSLKYIMETKNYSLAAVSKATGLSKSAISLWLNHTYSGKNDKVMDVIINFVQREKERCVEDSMPFVETSIVKYIFEIGRLCHTKGKIGVCAGKAGLGKTVAAKEYTRHYLDSIIIESDSGYTAKSLLLEIHKRLGLSGKGSVYVLMDEVITKLSNSGRLLIIDEAENLPYRALEITRRIHDKTGVGVLLLGRGPEGELNFNTSSDRIILCYPHLKVYDNETDSIKLQPYSQRLAGVIAAKDIEKGYHWSPSNTEIQGIVGVEKQLTSMINDPSSEVNTLNEAGVLTVFNSYGSGFRTWGNRSAAFPASTHPTNFINVRRTADILHESVEYSMLQFIDFPIDNGLIDSISETVNQFIRTLIGRGALIDGKCTFNQDKNPVTELANGHLLFDVEFMPPTPAERITFESFIDIELLKSLGA